MRSGWPAARRPSRILVLGGAALCLTAATAWIVGDWRTRTDSDPPLRLLTVTSQPGAEEDASLSADGRFVTYAWHPGTIANADLWLKAVDGEQARQLTDTPDVNEKWPQWSPDGQFIAYTSLVRGRPPSIFKVSQLGGAPTLITERAAHAIWTPDNESMVVVSVEEDSRTALVELVLATGARRTLMQAPAGYRDIFPRVSPDGRTLAFARSGSGRAAVFVMPMSGGDAKRLGNWNNGFIGGVSWTPDGRELLVSQPAVSGRRLVRLEVNGAAAAIDVRGVPQEAISPSVSFVFRGGSYRLAFVAGQPDLGLRLVDLHAPLDGDTITAVTPFCEATRLDIPGRFSPDGTLVAFTSDRGGNQQVWMAGRDGSSIRSLTRLPDAVVNVGGWSPDGRWVAFDAAIGDKTAIYRVSVDGALQQLTDDSATNTDPEWSRDGAWIYYASTASGREEIWKMPAGGGKGVQLTSEGGSEPRTSPDGRHVYFVDHARMPADAPPRHVEARVHRRRTLLRCVRRHRSRIVGCHGRWGRVHDARRQPGCGLARSRRSGHARHHDEPRPTAWRASVSCIAVRRHPAPRGVARRQMGDRQPHRPLGARHHGAGQLSLKSRSMSKKPTAPRRSRR